MKRILAIVIFQVVVLFANDFNIGPYGAEYFDIAGPFTLVDMNLQLGDVNADDVVNILDIIATVNHVLEYVIFTDVQITQVDLNYDGTVDILDIVALVNLVLAGNYNHMGDMNDDETLNILDIVTLANLVLSD